MARFFGVPMRNGVALGVASTLPMRGGLPVPALNLDFLSGSLDSRITFTRASTATFFDSTGTLQTAAINAARFDTNPSTLAPLGLLIEEQRTNSIRNNTMQGAVAGTPGTAPTNWIGDLGVSQGLSMSIPSIATVSGIQTINYRANGTTTSAGATVLQFENSNQIAATPGQVWTGTCYLALVAGSFANINSFSLTLREFDSGGAFLRQTLQSITSITSTLSRATVTATLGASTAFVSVGVRPDYPNSAAIDITLRIGLPQLEQGAFATSVIPTTTTALTRNADVASMTGTNFSSWYNQSAGTFVAQYSCAGTGGTDRRIFMVDDGVSLTANGMSAFISNAAQKAASFNNFVASSNIGRVDSVANFAANTTYRAAFAITNSDRALSVNGASAVTSTNSFTMPTLARLVIGSDVGTTSLCGYIQRIAYYPRRLPDSTLQALTA